MHSGSSELSEDAPVCATADQLLDERAKPLQYCSGSCVVGLCGRASCTQSDMLSLCISDLHDVVDAFVDWCDALYRLLAV